MRRLLSVIHGPAFGGAHNQLVRLAEPLRSRGFETIAMLPSEAEEAAARVREEGVETVVAPLSRLRAIPDPLAQLRFLRSLSADVATIRAVIGARGVEVVQAHGPTNPQAAIAAHRHGVATVCQVLDTRAPMALRRLTVPMLTRLADAATVWGEALAHEHPGLGRLGERLITVFPPIELERFAPAAKRTASARRRLGIRPGEAVIGTVGVLNPQKGHEHLIAAARRVAAERPEARLRLLGAPSPAHAGYEAMLRREASRLGEAASAVIVDPGREVADLIQALDVFVLASVRRSEGMPTAILEAMAAGKPVVATDVGAVRELVSDGVTGLVVAPEDGDAIATAVLTLLADPEARQAMGERGRRRAAERFDLGRLADRHATAYELAIEHRARRH